MVELSNHEIINLIRSFIRTGNIGFYLRKVKNYPN